MNKLKFACIVGLSVLTLSLFSSRAFASFGGDLCQGLTDQQCKTLFENASYYPNSSPINYISASASIGSSANVDSGSDQLGSSSAGLMMTGFPDAQPAKAADSWATLAKTFQTTADQKDKAFQNWMSSPKAQQMAATNPEAFNRYVENQERQISDDERFAAKYKKMADADLLKANQSKPVAQQMTVSRCENIGAGELSPTCTALLQNIKYSPASQPTSKPKVASVVKPASQTMNPQGRNYLDQSLAAGLGLPGKDLFLDSKTMSEAAQRIKSEASNLKNNVTRHNKKAKKIAFKTRKLKRARKAAKNKPVKSNDLVCFRYESQLSQQPLPFAGGLQQLFDRDCRGKNIDDSKTNQNEVAAPQQKKIVAAYQNCVKEAEGVVSDNSPYASVRRRDRDIAEEKASMLNSAAAIRACAAAQFAGKK